MASTSTITRDVRGEQECTVCGKQSEECQRVEYYEANIMLAQVVECKDCRKSIRRRNAKRANGNLQQHLA